MSSNISLEDMYPEEVDYDPENTAEFEWGYERGAEEERAKWLPLWEAVKELEKVDDFWSDRPSLINNNISSFAEKTFDNLNAHQQQQVTMARRELHRVLMVLRSQGEK